MSGARLLALGLLWGLSQPLPQSLSSAQFAGHKRKAAAGGLCLALGTSYPSVLSRGPRSAQGWPPRDYAPGMRRKEKRLPTDK